jgi:hypothetical protein
MFVPELVPKLDLDSVTGPKRSRRSLRCSTIIFTIEPTACLSLAPTEGPPTA